MEGIATKHRTPKDTENSPEKGGCKDKGNAKTPQSRKARNLASKRRSYDFSDEEEEPLAYARARTRPKREPEDSEDERVDSETEEKRAVQKRIKQETSTKRDPDESSVLPKTAK